MWLARSEELLKRFRAGDKDAMDLVYRHYEPGVTSFLKKGFSFRSGSSFYFYKGTKDKSDLESSVQEVFRRAFEEKARNSYNGITSFSNWVLAIARNMIINQFRNKEIAFSQFANDSDANSNFSPIDQELPEEYSGVLYAAPQLKQDDHFEKAELKQLLGGFLQDLSDHDRQLMLYRFSEGKGQEETANLLGSTRMKVRTAETRLKSRLKAYLSNTGYIKDK